MFFQKEISFLGYLISEDGIKPDPEKIKAIEKFPVPTNVKELSRFLGMIAYNRKFIKNCSKISAPLNHLLSKNVPFLWNQLCEEAFLELKQNLIQSPILSFPNPTWNYILNPDACHKGLGAVLEQVDPKTKHKITVAYASRTLMTSEKNHTTPALEMCALIFGLEKF